MIRAQWERWKNQVFPSGFMWPTQPSPIQSLAGLNSVLPKQKKTGGKKKSQRKVTVTTDRKSAQIHIRFFMNSGHITSGIWLNSIQRGFEHDRKVRKKTFLRFKTRN